MNILVTGASGFLGSNIVYKFRKNGHTVMTLSYRNSLPADLYNTLSYFLPDVVIHCAWCGGNNYAHAHDISQFNGNIPISFKLLNILSTIPSRPTFIGLGTMFEYGVKSYSMQEDDEELPIDLYGISKLVLKNYSRILCEKFNMRWIWIRPCYTYGPEDVPTRLIPRVITDMLKNTPIILDECNSIVDYLYVDDFTDAIYKLSNSNLDGVYNICSGNQYKIRDIILKISDIIDTNPIITFRHTVSSSKPKFICGNNTKITTNIDWIPQIKLDDGLYRTIEYNKTKYEKLNTFK